MGKSIYLNSFFPDMKFGWFFFFFNTFHSFKKEPTELHNSFFPDMKFVGCFFGSFFLHCYSLIKEAESEL